MVNWGDQKPETKQVLLPDETHRALKAVCARLGKSMTEVLNALVLDYIAQAAKEDKEADNGN